MKILFLVPGLSTRGGLQRVVTIIASRMGERNEVIIGITGENEEICFDINPKVKILSFQDCGSKKNIWGIMRKLIRSGFKFPQFLIKRSICSRRMISNLEQHINEGEYDLVIGVGDTLPLTLVLLNRNNLCNKKIKLFGWHHNTYEAYYCRKGWYSFGREKLAKQVLPRIDQIITLTKRDANILNQKLGVCSTYIYNPLSFRSSLKTNLQTKNLLFVGRIDREQKGIDLLLEIAEKIYATSQAAGWHLIIVGDGRDSKWMKRRILDIKLEGFISIVGSRDNIAECYLNADILLSTSRWEGFGIVITEAFECGLPVISFLNNGSAEIIKDGENGYLIHPFDVDVFADKTLELMSDYEKRKKFSEQAKLRAMDFSLDTIIKRWENVCEVD